MIRNEKLWREWEENFESSVPVDYRQNLRIVEALFEEARSLGVLPLRNPLEGIEGKIALARALHV